MNFRGLCFHSHQNLAAHQKGGRKREGNCISQWVVHTTLHDMSINHLGSLYNGNKALANTTFFCPCQPGNLTALTRTGFFHYKWYCEHKHVQRYGIKMFIKEQEDKARQVRAASEQCSESVKNNRVVVPLLNPVLPAVFGA